MAAHMSVLGLIMFSNPYLRSAMVRFPFLWSVMFVLICYNLSLLHAVNYIDIYISKTCILKSNGETKKLAGEHLPGWSLALATSVASTTSEAYSLQSWNPFLIIHPVWTLGICFLCLSHHIHSHYFFGLNTWSLILQLFLYDDDLLCDSLTS